MLPTLALSCLAESRSEGGYSIELDTYLGDTSKDHIEKSKLLIDDPEGVRAVEAWISRNRQSVKLDNQGHAIVPKAVLFISEQGDLDFLGDPAGRYDLYVSQENFKAVEKEEFGLLYEIFRKYGSPYSGAFKYEFLWEVQGIEYRSWCRVCKMRLGTSSPTPAGAEAVGKEHESQTGHSCKVLKLKLEEPVINKY